MTFVTKYTVAPYNGVEMNPYDAVDRLTYVDTTQQIVSFLRAGVNMRLQRSQTMIDSGADLNAPMTTVYAPDVAEAFAQLHKLQDELKENQRKLTEQREAAIKVKASVSPEKGADSDLPSNT